MLERRELGEAGRAYIRERLTGGKTLSKLLQALDLSAGETWTYLPPWATEEEAREFDNDAWLWTGSYLEGNLQRRGDARSTFDATIELVRRFLGEHDHGVAIWEDALKTATDPWVLQHSEGPLAFHGNEVYYLLKSETATDDSIETGLSGMVAWWGSPAVLATPPADVAAALPVRGEITREQLQAIVDNLQLLFFNAYDGMGYVFWKPLGRGSAM